MKHLHSFSMLTVIFMMTASFSQVLWPAKISADENGNVQDSNGSPESGAVPDGYLLPVETVRLNGKPVEYSEGQESVQPALLRPMNPGPNLRFYHQELDLTLLPIVRAGVWVDNNGTSSSGACHLGWYISSNETFNTSDMIIADDNIASLAPSGWASKIQSIDISSLSNTCFLGCIIDYQNEVIEDYENDNTVFVITIGPNLAPTSHGFYYTDPNLSYNIWIVNNGIKTAGPSHVGYYLSADMVIQRSDILIASKAVPSLQRNVTFNGSITIDVSSHPGIWYFGYWLDYLNEVDEGLDENDNWGGIVGGPILIAVPPQPDLIIPDVTVIDGTGPELSYKLTVKNQGGSETGIEFKNRIYLSADEIITSSDYLINDWNVTNSLAAGTSRTSYDITSTVSGVPGGEYYLGAIADAKQVIPESNEANNTGYCSTMMISIPEDETPPDTTILDVPMAGNAPVIDGIMDPVWYSVCSVPMEKFNIVEASAPSGWLDAFGSFKLMYDHENFYVFIRVHDDVINTSYPDYSWANDSFELLFDGDNSKNDLATGNDENDVLFQYLYNETREHYYNASHSVCRFVNTENGYDLEIQIPAMDMPFDLVSDHMFGFEMHMNDNDTGFRDHIVRWWNEDNATWHNPSLMGTARTTDYVAADPMYILQASEVPEIDGTADEAAWQNIPWQSSNKFIEKENGATFYPVPDLAQADGWNDCRFKYKLTWQGGILYFFAQVFDDVIDTSQPDWWMNDCMELQIDGNNDKGQTLDGNDHHYSFIFSDTPSQNAVFTATTAGWNVEAGIDLISDLGITPEIGHRIGLEIQNDDNDGGGRDLASRWWSNDNIAWANPSIRGTAELTGTQVVIPTGMGDSPASFLKSYYMDRNYPNPFNPSTTIRYAVSKPCFVKLTLYDLLGREIARLVDESQSPGEYSVVWNGRDFPSGIYIVNLTAGEFTGTRKMILQK